MSRSLLGLLALASTVGCIGGDDSPSYEPMCEVTADCDSGETCDEGICWGNPPPLHFAAELFPPETRSDLARTEIPSLLIKADGTIENAAFAAPVTVQGRVVIAGSAVDSSVGAKIVFRRPSRIRGGPDYVVSVESKSGKLYGEQAFSTRLLPNDPGVPEDRYEVSIYPDTPALAAAAAPDEPSPAELAPPLREYLVVTDDLDVVLTLGERDGLKEVRGRVIDAVNKGVAGMSVRAYGSFTAGGPRELASSLGFTDAAGAFTIWLPISWEDEFDVVAAPRSGATLPTILRHGVEVLDPSGSVEPISIPDIRLPTFPAAIDYVLPVQGWSPGGGLEPAAGTTLLFRTTLYEAAGDVVTFETTGIADPDGKVKVKLVPAALEGNRSYELSALPLPAAPYGTLWNETIELGVSGGTLADLVLPARVFVTGIVVDHLGEPQMGMSVRAAPSELFTQSLSAEQQQLLAAASWPETTSDQGGLFGIYLDAQVLNEVASYDLELLPPQSSLLPRWSIEDFDLDVATSGAATHDMGTLSLPDASYARGTVLDPQGEPVEGAEVRLYVVDDGAGLCSSLAPSDCVPPARLRSIAQSLSDGALFLILPSP